LAYTNAISSYREARVNTASQGQLIIMLYEAAVKQLDRALEFLEAKSEIKTNLANIEKISKAILKTQEIITELTVSLDFEQGGDIAQNLFSLYTWFNKELLEANIQHDASRIFAVRTHLQDLKGAWAEAAAQVTSNANKTITGVNIAG